MIFGLTGPTYDIGGAGPPLDENLLQNCRTPDEESHQAVS